MATEDSAFAPNAIHRMTQIITQKFQLPAASAASERAKRIFEELVLPQQLARRQAEREAEILRAENIRLKQELELVRQGVSA